MFSLTVDRSQILFGSRTPVFLQVDLLQAGWPAIRGIAINPDSEVRGVTLRTGDFIPPGPRFDVIEGQPYIGTLPSRVFLFPLDRTDGRLILDIAATPEDVESLRQRVNVRGSTDVVLQAQATAGGHNVILMVPRREDDRTRQISLQLSNPGLLQIVQVISQIYEDRGTGPTLVGEQLLGNVNVIGGTITVAVLNFDFPGNALRFNFTGTPAAGPMTGILSIGCA